MSEDTATLAQTLYDNGWEYVPDIPTLRSLTTLSTGVLEDRNFRQCVTTQLELLWKEKRVAKKAAKVARA